MEGEVEGWCKKAREPGCPKTVTNFKKVVTDMIAKALPPPFRCPSLHNLPYFNLLFPQLAHFHLSYPPSLCY